MGGSERPDEDRGVRVTQPAVLDRLVLFHEAEPGCAFRRLDDYRLEGGTR